MHLHLLSPPALSIFWDRHLSRRNKNMITYFVPPEFPGAACYRRVCPFSIGHTQTAISKCCSRLDRLGGQAQGFPQHLADETWTQGLKMVSTSHLSHQWLELMEWFYIFVSNITIGNGDYTFNGLFTSSRVDTNRQIFIRLPSLVSYGRRKRQTKHWRITRIWP